jgi:hypothetical protein
MRGGAGMRGGGGHEGGVGYGVGSGVGCGCGCGSGEGNDGCEGSIVNECRHAGIPRIPLLRIQYTPVRVRCGRACLDHRQRLASSCGAEGTVPCCVRVQIKRRPHRGSIPCWWIGSKCRKWGQRKSKKVKRCMDLKHCLYWLHLESSHQLFKLRVVDCLRTVYFSSQ